MKWLARMWAACGDKRGNSRLQGTGSHTCPDPIILRMAAGVVPSGAASVTVRRDWRSSTPVGPVAERWRLHIVGDRLEDQARSAKADTA